MIKTHKELVKLHGKQVSYKYKKRTLIGTISIRHRKKTQYVYICNNHYGKPVKELKVEESFGYEKAHGISYSTGLGRYEYKSSSIKKIILLAEKPKENKLTIKVMCTGLKTWYDMYNKFEESLNNMNKICKGEYDMKNSAEVRMLELHREIQGEREADEVYRSVYKCPPPFNRRLQAITAEYDNLSNEIRIAEEKNKMTDREQALKEIKEIKERMVTLENIIKKPETFVVQTPIESNKQIIFNRGTQLLRVSQRGFYVVESPEYITKYWDYSGKFVWIPCSREDLEVNDTVHFINSKYKDHFSCETTVGKVLNDNEIVYVSSEGNTIKTKKPFTYLYKLVSKEEL
jgi:hypothetical protein